MDTQFPTVEDTPKTPKNAYLGVSKLFFFLAVAYLTVSKLALSLKQSCFILF